jgi:amino acid transporter
MVWEVKEMNRTQKGAVAVLAIMTVLLIFGISVPIAWFNEMLVVRTIPLVFLGLAYLAMVLSIIFLRKKRGHREVDYDERDTAIKRKAVFASYITLWILVFLGCTIPFGVTDQKGTIPVSLLPAGLFVIFVIVMLVYALTILVQYGRGGKKE